MPNGVPVMFRFVFASPKIVLQLRAADPHLNRLAAGLHEGQGGQRPRAAL